VALGTVTGSSVTTGVSVTAKGATMAVVVVVVGWGRDTSVVVVRTVVVGAGVTVVVGAPRVKTAWGALPLHAAVTANATVTSFFTIGSSLKGS